MSTVNAFSFPRYVNREFLSNRAEGIEKIPQNCPNWTNFNLSDPGMVLFDYVTFCQDKLDFYLNRQAEESFPTVAQHARNTARGLKVINWFPNPPSAAEVTGYFTIDQNHSGFTIPKYFQATDTAERHIFYLVDDIIVPAGETSVSGVFRNAVPAPNFMVGVSTGMPYQIMSIPLARLTYGNTKVYGNVRDKLVEWDIVGNFVGRGPNEKICRLLNDENGRGVLWFGDNIEGLIPEKGTIFYIDAWSGGGSGGNSVGAGKLNTLITTMAYIDGITNPESASGGDDYPAIDKMKIAGPGSIATYKQANNTGKAEMLLADYPGVYDSSCVEYDSVIPDRLKPTRFWDMYCYITPVGGGIPSSAYLSKIKKYMYDQKIYGGRMSFLASIIYTFDISFTITLFSDAVESTVRQLCYAALDTYFSGLKMAVKVKSSDMINILEDVDGVDHVYITDYTITRSKGEDAELEIETGSYFDFYQMYAGERGYARAENNNFSIQWGSPTEV